SPHEMRWTSTVTPSCCSSKVLTSHSSSASGVSVSPASHRVTVVPSPSPAPGAPLCPAVSPVFASPPAAVLPPDEQAARTVAATAVATAARVVVLSLICGPLSVRVPFSLDPAGSHHPQLAVAHVRRRSLQDS